MWANIKKSVVPTGTNVFRLYRDEYQCNITYPEGMLTFTDAAVLLHNFSFLVPHNEWLNATEMAQALRKHSSHPRVVRLAEMLEKSGSE